MASKDLWADHLCDTHGYRCSCNPKASEADAIINKHWKLKPTLLMSSISHHLPSWNLAIFSDPLHTRYPTTTTSAIRSRTGSYLSYCSPNLHLLHACSNASCMWLSYPSITCIYISVCLTRICMCTYLWIKACLPPGFGCNTSSIMFHRLRMQMKITKLYLVVLEA